MDIVASELVLIALGYVVATIVIQRKFSNIKRIKEIKIHLNTKMAEMKKMDKNVSKEIMANAQKEMQDLTSEMMRHQLKASFLVIPLFVFLIYFALPYEFGGIAYSFIVPPTIVPAFALSYRSLFIAFSIILGLATQAVVAAYDKMAAKKAEATTQITTNNT